MKIFFSEGNPMTEGDADLKFNPKEGYEYTFMVRYEEYYTPTTRAADDEGGNETDTFTPCYGNFIMTMKVVPEYLVWQGTKIGINWNDDSQWKRATYSDIKAEENTTIPVYKGDEYAANPGYVRCVSQRSSFRETARWNYMKLDLKEIKDNIVMSYGRLKSIISHTWIHRQPMNTVFTRSNTI